MRIPKHLFFRRASIIPNPAPQTYAPPTPPGTPPLIPPLPVVYDADGLPIPVIAIPEKYVGPSIKDMVKQDFARMIILAREMDWREAWRKAKQRSMYKWYAILLVTIVLTALLGAKHEDVVRFCHPVILDIRNFPAGWTIPIVILIIVSFPPLMGHEIIGILVGLVWGLGFGFAILAAGTFLGEVATWVAFKWCCTARAAKFEKKNKLYATLTQLIREKSFMFVLVLRFSAVPGHITTAVSASAGANFWQYLAAAFLTLPKQFTIVYLGKAYGTKSFSNTVVSTTATIVTLVGTVVAAVYIYYQMRLVMIRQAFLLPTHAIQTGETLVPMSVSTTELPLARPDEKLQDRRPWLFTGNSFSTNLATARNQLRAWSLPGHMSDEEMREWMAEMDLERVSPGGRQEEGISRAEQQERHSFSPGADNPFGTPASADTSISTVPSVYIEPDTYPPTPTTGRQPPYYRPESGYSHRSTVSLDLPRPTRGNLGGREIADDSDLYAMSRGSRRPEFGRMRGESRAALLGRAENEDGDRNTELLSVGRRGKDRDYGRARGESGAALLGRPIEEDAVSMVSMVSENSAL